MLIFHKICFCVRYLCISIKVLRSLYVGIHCTYLPTYVVMKYCTYRYSQTKTVCTQLNLSSKGKISNLQVLLFIFNTFLIIYSNFLFRTKIHVFMYVTVLRYKNYYNFYHILPFLHMIDSHVAN